MKKILILQLSIAFWYASVAQIQATKQEVKSAAKQAISDFIIPSVSDNDEKVYIFAGKIGGKWYVIDQKNR